MNQPPNSVRFDQFELDESNALLTREGQAVQLAPKAFAVLCTLVRRPGQLTRKDALLDAVWGHRHVSESVLKTTISQLRAALADDPGEPRYIETVSRHGYRFIGRIAAQAIIAPAVAAAVPPPRRQASDDAAPQLPTLVGRRDALAQLHAAWKRALAGQRQLFWIAGEAGVGKTTLIERFVNEAGLDYVAYGQCVEQYGTGEPYLPVLEALKQMCRKDPELVPLMRSVAPAWLVQMPWLIEDADRAAMHANLSGAGQERMVRELRELMDRYTPRRPLLFVTEDLHWSDHATLRLMDHFARRRGPVHLLWLASFRLAQIVAEDHPLQQLRQEIQLHNLCEEVILDPFSEAELGEYVETRFPEQKFSETFIRKLHAHTDGLPLFVVNVLETVVSNAAREKAEPGRRPAEGERPLPLPENLAGAIERQIARLPAAVRAQLEAASVCGMEFQASTVADVLGVDHASVIECCDELVRKRYWLRDVAVVDLPDGRLDSRYAFHHALYKHVFYHRIAPTQRVAAHRKVARSMEAHRTLGVPVKYSELATHLELGREYMLALANYAEAAKSAIAHFAPQEAIELTGHALSLLDRCPETPERHEVELSLLAHRGIACAQFEGISSPASVTAFNRVRHLCDILPQTPSRALLLSGMGWGYYTRGEYAEAIGMSERVLALATEWNNPILYINACNLMGVSFATMGQHRSAYEWLQKGIEACDALDGNVPMPVFIVDPEVSMRANICMPLMAMGLLDQARMQARRSHERAERIGQPMARMLAHWCGAMLAVRLNEADRVTKHAAAMAEIVALAVLGQGLGPSLWLRGWAEARRGEAEQGYKRILEGYSCHERFGMYAGCTEVLGYAVEALILQQRWDDAQSQLNDALQLVHRLNERIGLVDLLLMQSRIAQGKGDVVSARSSAQAAVTEARRQGAMAFELNALLALSEIESDGSHRQEIRETYAQFTEGHDTQLCERARAALA